MQQVDKNEIFVKMKLKQRGNGACHQDWSFFAKDVGHQTQLELSSAVNAASLSGIKTTLYQNKLEAQTTALERQEPDAQTARDKHPSQIQPHITASTAAKHSPPSPPSYFYP